MVVVSIFWSALMVLLLFSLAICLHVVAGIIAAIYETTEMGVTLLLWALIIYGAGYLIYEIIQALHTQDVGSVVLEVIVLIVLCGIVISLVGPIGGTILATVIAAIYLVLGKILSVSEFLAQKCELGCLHFLTVIFKRTDKC